MISALATLMLLSTAVTIQGTATDAKVGAFVQATNGEPIYITGLDAWPPELAGRVVTATGTPRAKKKILDPVTNADGAMRERGNRTVQLLDNARYALLRDDWRTAAGASVTVRGTAGNAKAGAAVLTPFPVYVRGLAAWPKEIDGKPVSATGRLVRHVTPESRSDPPAAQIAGEWFTLEDARWSSP